MRSPTADPDLDAAYRLHRDADLLTRGAVEGRILAGLSFPEAAAASGLTMGPSGPTSRCSSTWWETCTPVSGSRAGPSARYQDGLTERDVDLILKRVGFCAGPAALEMVLKYFTTRRSVPRTLTGLTRPRLEELGDRLSTRALILAWTLPYPACERAGVLQNLTNELDALAASAPDPAAAATEVVRPPADRAAWWSAWRRAVRAASGRLSGPAPRHVRRAA